MFSKFRGFLGPPRRCHSESRNRSTGWKLRTKAGENCRALFPSWYSTEHAEVIRVNRASWSQKFGKSRVYQCHFWTHGVFISVLCTVRLWWKYTKIFSFNKHIRSGSLVPGTAVDTENKEINKKDEISPLEEGGEEPRQYTSDESALATLTGPQNHYASKHPFILVFLGTQFGGRD